MADLHTAEMFQSPEAQLHAVTEKFTKHIGTLDVPYLIAAGMSASDLALNMQQIAQASHIQIPEIFPLNRQESFSLYQAGDIPIPSILAPMVNKYGTGDMHFIEDFTVSGSKIKMIHET